MTRFFLIVLLWSLRATLRSRHSVVLENLALRQQLATYARGRKRPQLKPEERSFWVASPALAKNDPVALGRTDPVVEPGESC